MNCDAEGDPPVTPPRADDAGTPVVPVPLAVGRRVGTADPRLFGSFVEHLGRGVYGGVFAPGDPSATPEGFRADVLELVRELGRECRALPRWQLRLRVRLAGRHRPPRGTSAAAGPRVAVRRVQHLRHRRVRRLVPAGRRRADARPQPRPRRHPLRPAAARVREPPGWHHACPTSACATARPSRTTFACGAWATRPTGRGSSGTARCTTTPSAPRRRQRRCGCSTRRSSSWWSAARTRR